MVGSIMKRKKIPLWVMYLIIAIVIAGGYASIVNAADVGIKQRDVKVAFFPMEGYHVMNRDGSYGGVEVEYLKAISEYVDWNIEYVKCDSWEEALLMLEEKKVDLVGTSQYTKERAEKFLYANMSSGYTFGAVATNADKNIAFEDFTMMKDIKYGMVSGYVRKDEFFEYLSSNGIESPNVTEYVSTRELQNALDKGEIDALVHTFMEVEEGQRLIGRFASRPTYFMTYKENEEFMKELDAAIVDVQYNYPGLVSELMYEFYESKWDNEVLYSLAEDEYLKEKGSIVIGYMDGYYPFAYLEDGEFKGLIKEKLQGKSIDFEFEKVNGREDGIKKLKDGKIDALAHICDTYDVSSDDGLQLLSTYSKIPFVLVTSRDRSEESVETIVTIKDFKTRIHQIIDTKDKKIKYVNTLQECFEIAEKGEADAIIGGGYLADRLISTNSNYATFTISSVLNEEIAVHMMVDAGADERLKSIINKTLGSIDEKTVNEYMMEEKTYTVMSFKSFIRDNVFVIFSILMLIIVIIVAVSAYTIHNGNKIQQLLYRDLNMNIWNQHYFTKIVEKKRNIKSKRKYAIVYTSLVGIKQYVLVYGRKAGFNVYKCICKSLVDSIDAKEELCARISNDHFLTLLQYGDYEELTDRLEEIKKKVEEAVFELTDNSMQLQLGVCPNIHNDREVQMLMECAIQVLDEGAEDKKQIYIYDEDYAKQVKERLNKEKMLKSITIDDNFLVYYQNKVDIRTEQIVGAEALVRLSDPEDDGKIKSPWFFISYFEKIGRISEIDFFVFENVCKMLKRRIDAGLRVVPISCNFSRANFVTGGFTKKFEEVIDKYNIPKELVEVEITETLVVEQQQFYTIFENIQEMKAHGIHMAIDDFGAGYSSLGIFEHVPASVIKLDRSFMLNQEDEDRQIKIMKGIVKMSNELDAQVVCEGVETEENISLMKEINAYIAQGYFYSKPVPEEVFESML